MATGLGVPPLFRRSAASFPQIVEWYPIESVQIPQVPQVPQVWRDSPGETAGWRAPFPKARDNGFFIKIIIDIDYVKEI
jgi:hypothetical protein